MDRDDILSLYVVAGLPLPKCALPLEEGRDDIYGNIPF
jgi:hypothetical protein